MTETVRTFAEEDAAESNTCVSIFKCCALMASSYPARPYQLEAWSACAADGFRPIPKSAMVVARMPMKKILSRRNREEVRESIGGRVTPLLLLWMTDQMPFPDKLIDSTIVTAFFLPARRQWHMLSRK